MQAEHNAIHLAQMQSLPLIAKVHMTKQRIRAWYKYWDGDVYVSFSGGKDSTVLKHIVDSIYRDVPSVFVNTGLEYPEVRSFALQQRNVVRLDPKMKFYDVIEQYGYPVVSKEQAQYIREARTTNSQKLLDMRLNGKNGTRLGRISERWKFLLDAPFKISEQCCSVMKKSPVKTYEKETGRKVIVGTLAVESNLRMQTWYQYGCNAFKKTRPTSQPLSFWTEQDILQYIVENELEIASVYGDIIQDENGKYKLTGLQRTGCMFCMFGVHAETTPNRFQQMAVTHPKQYNYCMNQLGIKDVLDYIDVDYKPVNFVKRD